MSRFHPLQDDLVNELVKQLTDGELILFAGAGFSYLASNAKGQRLPLWDGLAKKVARHFHMNYSNHKKDPLELFDAVCNKHGRDKLYEFLR
jgi:hypothetical protein